MMPGLLAIHRCRLKALKPPMGQASSQLTSMDTTQSPTTAPQPTSTPATLPSVSASHQPWHSENFAWWTAMSAMTPSVYGCIRTNPDLPPLLDGDPCGLAWQEAPWSNDFQDIQGHLQPTPRFKTQASCMTPQGIELLLDECIGYAVKGIYTIYGTLSCPKMYGATLRHTISYALSKRTGWVSAAPGVPSQAMLGLA